MKWLPLPDIGPQPDNPPKPEGGEDQPGAA
jgi:hypothetical protein